VSDQDHDQQVDQLADQLDVVQTKASIWKSKPWWCQPWSILLTGLTVIVLSWWLLRSLWITGLVALAVLAWWLLFLVFVPSIDRQARI